MSDPGDEARDERLLDDLRQAFGPDLPPAGMAARAADLYTFASLDRDLAELLDTAAGPVGVRGTGGEPGTRLVFQARDGSFAIELSVTDDRLDGQVLAGAATEVVLEQPSGPDRETPVDELGSFGFDRPAAGPSRLRVRGGWTRPVTTDWFLL